MKGRLGHLAGFAESDEKVRSVPLFLNDDRDQPALSWRVATALAHDRKLSSPSDGLLRYIEPAPGPDFLAVTLDQLREDRDNVRMRLAERFLLVGEDSKQETFATPFGDRLGVMIHAGAVDSLLAGAYVRKSPWWSVVMLIMLASYAVAWPASRGMGLRWILAGAAAATLACFVFAAAAAYAASVWIDVVYPALAAFLLVPLVTIFRRVPPLR
jgi:CHASE2 domain-containing sensor protein